MDINLIETITWAFIYFSFFFIFHFLQKYLIKKNLENKKVIEDLKRKNPEKSYALKESWNKYMLTYTYTLKIVKWVFILFALLIVLRFFWFK